MHKINSENTCILTVPRSGSNLLQDTINAMGLFKLYKIHRCWEREGRNIVTIIRDPLDTLSSWAAMRMHYRDGNINSDIVSQYCSTYEYLIKHADIIIDYNELIDNPFKISREVIHYVNRRSIFKNPFVPKGLDRVQTLHLVTSKVSDHYDKAKKMMSKEDLSRCYALYEKAMSLKTNFN